MDKTWILVAESSRATIYGQAARHTPLHELGSFIHMASKEASIAAHGDNRGRTFDRMGGGRHAMEPDTGPKRVEAEFFARSLREYLIEAKNKGHFHNLIIMASPLFLGLLRKNCPHELEKSIIGHVNKNFVKHDVKVIQQHLPFDFRVIT